MQYRILYFCCFWVVFFHFSLVSLTFLISLISLVSLVSLVYLFFLVAGHEFFTAPNLIRVLQRNQPVTAFLCSNERMYVVSVCVCVFVFIALCVLAGVGDWVNMVLNGTAKLLTMD